MNSEAIYKLLKHLVFDPMDVDFTVERDENYSHVEWYDIYVRIDNKRYYSLFEEFDPSYWIFIENLEDEISEAMKYFHQGREETSIDLYFVKDTEGIKEKVEDFLEENKEKLKEFDIEVEGVEVHKYYETVPHLQLEFTFSDNTPRYGLAGLMNMFTSLDEFSLTQRKD